MPKNRTYYEQIISQIPGYANAAMDVLNAHNFECFIVGGFVRDAIIAAGADCYTGEASSAGDGEPGTAKARESAAAAAEEAGATFADAAHSHKPRTSNSQVYWDVDIATNAHWSKVKEIFEAAGWKVIETGIKHGTVTIIYKGKPIEVTTYRTESTYSDNRHPDSVNFVDDINQDLGRRDFTINAMAFNKDKGLIDNYGGINDIQSKIIKTVGDAHKRFSEDALRIVRALRFAAQLGFDIEANTQSCMYEQKGLIDNIAKERINEEFSKTICNQYAFDTLLKYQEIVAQIIPELKPCMGFDQHTKYHMYDVYEHSLHTLDNMPALQKGQHLKTSTTILVGRLAALLHDIGKPATFFTDENGQGHFYGHPQISEKIAKTILRRLKYSKNVEKMTRIIILWHDNPTKPTNKSVRKMCKRLCEAGDKYDIQVLFNLLTDLRLADTKAHAQQYCDRTEEVEEVRKVFNQVIESGQAFCINQLEIKGGDLIKLGYKPGPIISETLQALLNSVINGKLKNKKEQLLKAAQKRIQ